MRSLLPTHRALQDPEGTRTGRSATSARIDDRLTHLDAC
jgi:hypothetical protein